MVPVLPLMGMMEMEQPQVQEEAVPVMEQPLMGEEAAGYQEEDQGKEVR